MINFILKKISCLRDFAYMYRKRKWLSNLKKMGMQIGKDVNLPKSTWIDVPHCFLISIGDKCGFGEQCAILAHDAMPNEYIDATKIGRVKIHESCHFGMRTIIAPGVEIGPRSIVGSNSVVVGDIPPETIAAGNPAKVICTLDEYLNKHIALMENAYSFEYEKYSTQFLDMNKTEEMINKLDKSIGYMVGGYTYMEKTHKCLDRTS